MGQIGLPCTPPRTLRDLCYFAHWTSQMMKIWCHHRQIGMNPLFDAIFKMAANKLINAYNSASRRARDMILGSRHMFLGMRNPMEHIKMGFGGQPSWISRWLPQKWVKRSFFTPWMDGSLSFRSILMFWNATKLKVYILIYLVSKKFKMATNEATKIAVYCI